MKIHQVMGHVYYRIDNRRRLFIFGYGGIPEYAPKFIEDEEDEIFGFYNRPPWEDEFYTEVIICPGITRIGRYAFHNAESIQSVKMADTVTQIGVGCFRGCTDLEYVKLSRNLTYIPKNVFRDCSNISRFIISGKMQDMHPTAFIGVDLSSFEFVRDKRWEIRSAGLYDTESKELMIGKNRKHIKIEESTVGIAPYAFAYHDKVENVECTESMEYIGHSAFEGCHNLKNVYQLSGKTVIGIKAFRMTSGLRVHYISSVPKRRIEQTIPKVAVCDQGAGYLKNGEFTFYAFEHNLDLDPTNFYCYQDLADLKAGKDFIVGLRANGTVIFAQAKEKTENYRGPICMEEYSLFERMRGWNQVIQIVVTETQVAALREDGMIYWSELENENIPMNLWEGIVYIDIKDTLIGAKENGEVVRYKVYDGE